MYALLCGAIDDALERLENIPQARGETESLKAALLKAEEMYVCEADKGRKSKNRHSAK